MDLFTNMEHHGSCFITEMNMEMTLVKGLLITKMIEKHNGKRNTRQKSTTSKFYAPSDTIYEEFISIEK